MNTHVFLVRLLELCVFLLYVYLFRSVYWGNAEARYYDGRVSIFETFVRIIYYNGQRTCKISSHVPKVNDILNGAANS